MEATTSKDALARPKKIRVKPAERRARLRETLWPGFVEKIWDRLKNDGFTTIPRLLSLICSLLKALAKNDPTRVYLDLWCRTFDEGIIENIDPDKAAFSSGYLGNRATRTWTDHMYQLEGLGFIKIKSEGNKQIVHVLILNPLLVIDELHKRKPSKISEDWWTAYVARANAIGAALPSDAADAIHA